MCHLDTHAHSVKFKSISLSIYCGGKKLKTISSSSDFPRFIFACMYGCALSICLGQTELEEKAGPLELELQMAMRGHIVLGTEFSKGNKRSSLLTHYSSHFPLLFIYF